MYRKIKNADELLKSGDVRSREIVLEITDRTLQRLDGYERIKGIMSLEGDILTIGYASWDLSEKDHIYCFGAGKACNAMAMAVDEILGERLTKGIAIVKIPEEEDRYQNTDVYVGGHPLPNEEGRRGCLKMLDIISGAGERDLFIVLVSGGSSALMGCPIEGITLEDEQKATDIMLKSGANVLEINAVRRHISRINGGRLAQSIEKTGADMIGISIFDAVGYPPTSDIRVPLKNFPNGPMGPDNTTLEMARKVLTDYNIEDRIPASLSHYLRTCGPEGETPKEFPRFTYFLLNTVADSCAYAKAIAGEMGIPAMILTTFIEGESSEAGLFLAGIAREIQENSNPIKAPCVLLCSGETTTRIPDNSLIGGHGGPSQELTAGFALRADNIPGVCLLSIDSEGTDGTTIMAGGITDSRTLYEAEKGNVNLRKAIREHATFEALNPLNCEVFTGNTGTNLCDFNIMYIPEREADNRE